MITPELDIEKMSHEEIQLLTSFAMAKSLSSFFRPRGRELKFTKLDSPHRRQYSVYVSGGDWWEDKLEMEAWCSQQFGGYNEKYHNPRWKRDAFTFKFKNEKDAMMFMLRWG
jgi:hypothetical protein